MVIEFLQPPQFRSRTASDFAIARGQLCLIKHGEDNPVHLSRGLTREWKRPIVAVPLNHLIHQAPSAPDEKLTDDQAEVHAIILKAIAQEAFPEDTYLRNYWVWEQTGYLCSVNTFSDIVDIRNHVPHITIEDLSFPTRLHGNWYVQGCVMATPSLRGDRKEPWHLISGFPLNRITRIPEGNWAPVFSLGHEGTHTFQLSEEKCVEGSDQPRFDRESNADFGSISGLNIIATDFYPDKAAEIEQTIAGVAHGRATNAFWGARRHYMFAHRMHGDMSVGLDAAELVNCETRFRAYAQMRGIGIPTKSKDLKAIILEWRKIYKQGDVYSETLQTAFYKNPWDWENYRDPDISIPALYKVQKNGGRGLDDLTAANIDYIIRGAIFFHPEVEDLFGIQSYSYGIRKEPEPSDRATEVYKVPSSEPALVH